MVQINPHLRPNPCRFMLLRFSCTDSLGNVTEYASNHLHAYQHWTTAMLDRPNPTSMVEITSPTPPPLPPYFSPSPPPILIHTHLVMLLRIRAIACILIGIGQPRCWTDQKQTSMVHMPFRLPSPFIIIQTHFVMLLSMRQIACILNGIGQPSSWPDQTQRRWYTPPPFSPGFNPPPPLS